jgi:hypothetical protein
MGKEIFTTSYLITSHLTHNESMATLTHCMGLHPDGPRRDVLRDMPEVIVLRLHMDIREVLKGNNRSIAHVSEMVRTSFEVNQKVPVNPTFGGSGGVGGGGG